MKKITSLFLFILCIQTIKAQFVTIPDANFVAWLQANVPSAMIGNQMDTTSLAVTSRTFVDVGSQNIFNLNGIQYFKSLTNLWCNNNNISNLPPLSNSLSYLLCNNNQLTNLPILPSTLININCSNNQLTNLPSLPTNLLVLNCSHNNISCLPIFPNMPSVYIPDIAGFIKALDISSNPFTCLPNYVGAMDSVTLNYPLCVPGNTLTNINNCIKGYGITGSIFHDLNFDCLKNTNELAYTNTIVKLYNNTTNQFIGLTSTGTNGLYNFNVPNGIYQVVLDTVNKPFIVQCINPGIDSLVNLSFTQSIEDSVDFAVTCKPGFDIGVQSINTLGIIFPGQIHVLNINAGDMTQWYNMNCTSGVAGTVSFSINGPVTFVGAAPSALVPNVIGNIYTYTIANFATVQNNNDFRLLFTTNSTAQVGEMICVNATVTPFAGDNYTPNNTFQYCYPVVNSYDPNIKEVYPVEVSPNYNDWLTYTIHFQNTGNAPAMNIRLEDELDSKLNPETFELINYSHYNVIDVTGNHLTVRFPNIQLADSTSNPQSSIGFIQYRIKPKAGWITDTIKNSADIYFDYNTPIVTNTAKSYFVAPTAISKIEQNLDLSLYPNPTNSSVFINSKTDLNKIEVCNVTGQILLSEKFIGKTYQLQLQNLVKGIYFIKVIYNDGQSITKKVIKL
jgi:uncharacterized repeat protein (TIGR01451 family)